MRLEQFQGEPTIAISLTPLNFVHAVPHESIIYLFIFDLPIVFDRDGEICTSNKK